MIQEFHGFQNNFFSIRSEHYYTLGWYEQFKKWYLLLFHLIFVIDVSIAIIGYSFASRWLDNRTRSVDATLGGWFVALMCYPPLNTAFTSQFISYKGLDTHSIITQDFYLAIILMLQLLLYMVYVWSTTALGFKFSNLTNRGIVSIGPYSYVRHPAYASKNLSWWIDNSYVLTNIWATLAMAMWNLIYIVRAITEERHLNHDKEYLAYSKKVKYRFIPKWI
ncbi:MAG: isoprenylcysteine carboxylmethyltransferase family protein [Sulfurovum sp.]|nr:isoprenylcysteine carboxylmethyltransferase family protein [Sulfurovum sp.]